MEIYGGSDKASRACTISMGATFRDYFKMKGLLPSDVECPRGAFDSPYLNAVIREQVEKTDLSACLDQEWLWNAGTVTGVAVISEFILKHGLARYFSGQINLALLDPKCTIFTENHPLMF
jgi:hypothetical protein